LKKGRKHI